MRSAHRNTGIGGLALFLVLAGAVHGAACEENFDDIYIGPRAGAAGLGGAAGAQGGGAGAAQGGEGGAAGLAGSAGLGGAAGAGGTCAARCQGKVREECVDGVYKPAETCLVDCAMGACLSVKGLSAGKESTCALLSDGSVRCWGDNSQGQIGSGDLVEPILVPQAVPLGQPAKAVAAGEQHTCALVDNGDVLCWGRNDQGQVSDGAGGPDQNVLKPSKVVLPGKATGLALGSAHSCALLEENRVVCWGAGDLGQLGDGIEGGGHTAKALVNALPAGVTALAAGGRRSCVVAALDEVWCWGEVPLDEAAQGASQLAPTRVDGLSDAESLSVGPNHACASDSAGGADCWGANQSGQLGNGVQDTSSESPQGVIITGGKPAAGVLALAVGERHSCLLQLNIAELTDVRCWGANDTMQLGVAGEASPLAVLLDSKLWKGTTALVAGSNHTCGVLEAGTMVRCFGANTRGQLGRGGVSASETPGAVVW